jgi:hypothetical protein
MLPDADAGDADAGVTPPMMSDGGCGCVVTSAGETRFDAGVLALFIAVSMLVRARRRS